MGRGEEGTKVGVRVVLGEGVGNEEDSGEEELPSVRTFDLGTVSFSSLLGGLKAVVGSMSVSSMASSVSVAPPVRGDSAGDSEEFSEAF